MTGKRTRIYLPQADLPRFRRQRRRDIAAGRWSANWAALMDFQIDRARDLMLRGAPLVHALPGRIGWEIRLTVQGGLRILERIAACAATSSTRRPTLGQMATGCVVAGRSLYNCRHR